MSFESHLNNVFNTLLSEEMASTITKEQLIHCIDLTILDESASEESLMTLQEQATVNQVAAVCVLIQHLHLFKQPAPYKLATVINFPHGSNDLKSAMNELEHAFELGADEIDYVFSYQEYLTGNRAHALHQCEQIINACKHRQKTIKVILESGAFPDADSVYQASMDLIALNCDFIKTSTGKIAKGASLVDVFAMLSALNDSSNHECGLKVSGGVKTQKQARHYALLAELILKKKINNDWFRIGASSLLSELVNSKDDSKPH